MTPDPHLTARALGEELPDSPPVEPASAAEDEMAAMRDMADELRNAFRLQQQNSGFDLGESRTQTLQLILQSARPSRPVTFLRTAGWVSLGAAAAIALGLFVRIDSPRGSMPLAEAVYDPFFALESIERLHPASAITENPLRSLSSPGIPATQELQAPLRPPQLSDYRLADSAFPLRSLPQLPESPLLEEFTRNSEKQNSLVLVAYADTASRQPLLGSAASPAESFIRPPTEMLTSSTHHEWVDPVITPLVKLINASKNKNLSVTQNVPNSENGQTKNSANSIFYEALYVKNVESIRVVIPAELATHDVRHYVLEINPRLVSRYQVESHVVHADGSHEISVNFERRSSDPRRLDTPELRYQLRSSRLTREARSGEIACLSVLDSRERVIEMLPLHASAR